MTVSILSTLSTTFSSSIAVLPLFLADASGLSTDSVRRYYSSANYAIVSHTGKTLKFKTGAQKGEANVLGKIKQRVGTLEQQSAELFSLLATPVVIDTTDAETADNVRMVVQATGRQAMRSDEAETIYGTRARNLLTWLDDAVAAELGGDDPLQLAENLGRSDRLRIHVCGVQGGAGTSSLAVHLAATLSKVMEYQDPQAAVQLIDDDKYSIGMDLNFGWENLSELGAAGSWADHGISPPNAPNMCVFLQKPHEATGGKSQLTVVDCGRFGQANMKASEHEAQRREELLILVATPTQAGALELRKGLSYSEELGIACIGVFRPVGEGTSVPTVLRQLLGSAPVVTWPWQAAIAQEPELGFDGMPSPQDFELARHVLAHRAGEQWNQP